MADSKNHIKGSPFITFGTCSWNYDSWTGLVYSHPQPYAAAYLPEYTKKFRTVEIDSWFYKIPSIKEVKSYKDAVDKDFRFTCKVPQQISITHARAHKPDEDLVANPDFLSMPFFKRFLDVIEPILPQTDAVMLEFEYLNKKKMPSEDQFLDQLAEFAGKCPKEIPLAIETRNGNFINEKYFSLIKEKKLIHVFSEKQYMPHVYEVFEKFRDFIEKKSVIRLLGGDRKEMEEKTHEQWDKIVEEKPDKDKVVAMLNAMALKKVQTTVNVNNHYEGSSPLTIESLEKAIK